MYNLDILFKLITSIFINIVSRLLPHSKNIELKDISKDKDFIVTNLGKDNAAVKTVK